MKLLRRIVARVLIALGVLVLALWASARFLVNTVEDGTVVSGIAGAALRTPPIQSLIAGQVRSSIDASLAAEGIDPAEFGLEGALTAAIDEAVGSEGFIDALVDLIREAESGLIAQLTDDSLPLGPLTVSIDVTQTVQSTLGQNSQVADLVPSGTLAPVTVDLLDADEVDRVRGGYGWVERLSTWGLWIALGLLALGFVLMPSKRWILPRLFLGFGLAVLALWGLARWVTVESVVKWVPGGSEGTVAETIRDLVPQESVDRIEGKLLLLAVGLLALSGILFALIWWMFRDRGSDSGRKREREPEPEPEPELEPVADQAAPAAPLPARAVAASPPPLSVPPAEPPAAPGIPGTPPPPVPPPSVSPPTVPPGGPGSPPPPVPPPSTAPPSVAGAPVKPPETDDPIL